MAQPLPPEEMRRRLVRLANLERLYADLQEKSCISAPGIPADNNKAERSLRHLVLKRKSSFGSRTQKGADLMSVLYSVLLSLWWRSKTTFFQNYAALLDTS